VTTRLICFNGMVLEFPVFIVPRYVIIHKLDFTASGSFGNTLAVTAHSSLNYNRRRRPGVKLFALDPQTDYCAVTGVPRYI